MARLCNPLFITFAVACIILIAAFNSHHGETIKTAAGSFRTGGNSGNLAAKLELYERLWRENIKGRKTMKAWYDNNKRKDRK